MKFFFFLVIVCIGLTSLISACSEEIGNGNVFYLAELVVLSALLVLILIFIYLQPTCDKRLSFSVRIIIMFIFLSFKAQ